MWAFIDIAACYLFGVTRGCIGVGLEENVLSDKQERYVRWLTTAPALREPSSKLAFASEVGVDVTTLHRWEKREVFRKQWASQVDEVVGSPERTQRLLDRLFDAGMDGDEKAARLYFQVLGKLAPQQMNVSVDKKGSDMSDAELDAAIAAGALREKAARGS